MQTQALLFCARGRRNCPPVLISIRRLLEKLRLTPPGAVPLPLLEFDLLFVPLSFVLGSLGVSRPDSNLEPRD